jgi:hypothetical protein
MPSSLMFGDCHSGSIAASDATTITMLSPFL